MLPVRDAGGLWLELRLLEEEATWARLCLGRELTGTWQCDQDFGRLEGGGDDDDETEDLGSAASEIRRITTTGAFLDEDEDKDEVDEEDVCM